jgi:lipopolysaccharide transport system permease protein
MGIAATFHALIALAVWLTGYLLLVGRLNLTVLYFPLVFAMFFPVLLGIGWLLSALGVVLRDIGQLTGMVSHVLLSLVFAWLSLIIFKRLRTSFADLV